MPTVRFEQLFDPDFSKASARNQIDAALNLIEEVRNYGLWLFARCSNRPEGGDENLAILSLYYHLIEMLDAIGVLIEECTAAPARLQLRAIFETLLGIEFILQADTVRRAHAYLVVDILNRIEFYETLDSGTEAGRLFQIAIASDPDCSRMRLPSPKREAIANLKRDLTAPLFAEAFMEYQSASRRHLEWYQLFGGPNDLRELAKRVKHEGAYEILYGGLSQTEHATDVIQRNIVDKGGRPAVRPIRSSLEMSTIVTLAVNFAIQATRLMIRRYRPGEEARFHEWNTSEISNLWRAVASGAALARPLSS